MFRLRFQSKPNEPKPRRCMHECYKETPATFTKPVINSQYVKLRGCKHEECQQHLKTFYSPQRRECLECHKVWIVDGHGNSIPDMYMATVD